MRVIFRKLFLAILVTSSAYSLNDYIPDRLYFLLYNQNYHEMRDTKDVTLALNPNLSPSQVSSSKGGYENLRFGTLVKKNLYYEDFDLSGTLISKRVFRNKGKGRDKSYLRFKEIFASTSALDGDLDVSVGREVIPFSSTITYSINDFISSSPSPANLNDRTMDEVGTDGVKLVYYFDDIKIGSYARVDSVVNERKRKKKYHVLEMSNEFDNLVLDLLHKTKEGEKPSYGMNLSYALIDSVNVNNESKLHDNKVDSIVGFTYTPTATWSFTYEKLFLTSGETKEERKESLREIRTKDRTTNNAYYSSLQSEDYNNILIRYAKNDLALTNVNTLNQTDNSKRLLLQAEYKIEDYTLVLSATDFSGSTLSEFGSNPNKTIYSFLFSVDFVR